MSGPATPGDRVGELLERIAEAAGIDAEVEVEEGAEEIRAEFVGEDLGLLIGHHGQTIDAIQHVAYRVAFGPGDRRRPVTVDAAGYRARRNQAICAEADNAAAAAVRDGRPVALNAMNALERRVAHEHLRDHREVETYSEGDEPERHLVVAPVVTR